MTMVNNEVQFMVYSHADKGDVKPQRRGFRAIGGRSANPHVWYRSHR